MGEAHKTADNTGRMIVIYMKPAVALASGRPGTVCEGTLAALSSEHRQIVVGRKAVSPKLRFGSDDRRQAVGIFVTPFPIAGAAVSSPSLAFFRPLCRDPCGLILTVTFQAVRELPVTATTVVGEVL
jgi:hypothetical protein